MSFITESLPVQIAPGIVSGLVAILTAIPSVVIGVVALAMGPKAIPVDFEGSAPSRFGDHY